MTDSGEGRRPPEAPQEQAGTPWRQRCCPRPDIEAVWGIGDGANNVITVTCLACGTDLLNVWPDGSTPPSSPP